MVQVDLSLVDPGPNDRQVFNPNELQQLAENIKANGLAQKPMFRPKGQRFEIVCGERRTRAVRLLGWTHIEAEVVEMDDEKAAAIMLAENVQRAQLNPVEEGRAYKRRMDNFGWTFAECARRCNVSTDKVRNRVILLNLMPEVQTLVANNHMPLAHAQAMGVLDKNHQMVALRALKGKHLTAEKFQAVVSELEREQNQASMFDMAALELQVEKQVDKLLADPAAGQSFVSLTLANGAIVYVMVQHTPGQTVEIDPRYIAQAIKFIN